MHRCYFIEPDEAYLPEDFLIFDCTYNRSKKPAIAWIQDKKGRKITITEIIPAFHLPPEIYIITFCFQGPSEDNAVTSQIKIQWK